MRISTPVNTCPDCGRFPDTNNRVVSSGIEQHCCAEGIVRSAKEEGVRISSCSHDDTTVHYHRAGGLPFLSVTYPDKREASIQALMVLFPGTSRAWLERMHGRA